MTILRVEPSTRMPFDGRPRRIFTRKWNMTPKTKRLLTGWRPEILKLSGREGKDWWLKLVDIQRAWSGPGVYEPDAGDIWQVAEKKGDCEDLGLRMGYDAELAGMPKGAFRLTIGRLRMRRTLWHAVCRVVTDRGDYLMDCNARAVLAWEAFWHMEWIFSQTGDGMDFARFSGAG